MTPTKKTTPNKLRKIFDVFNIIMFTTKLSSYYIQVKIQMMLIYYNYNQNIYRFLDRVDPSNDANLLLITIKRPIYFIKFKW